MILVAMDMCTIAFSSGNMLPTNPRPAGEDSRYHLANLNRGEVRIAGESRDLLVNRDSKWGVQKWQDFLCGLMRKLGTAGATDLAPTVWMVIPSRLKEFSYLPK